MKSIAYIPASNQATNASQMTVQSVRSPGATDIIVNTVTGAPTKFYGSMGAPHTFTDPVTGETITIISEATAVDFAGHLDSGKVVIDVIAPGYVDTRGSLVGDIVVIRPVTEWANNIFNVLSESHNDDGTLKNSAITYSPIVLDHIASGAVLTGLGYGSTLTASLSAGVAWINGIKQTIAAVASRAYTASKDTYVDVLYNASGTATIVYTEVANNAASPALAANSIRLGIIVTDATNILNAGSVNQGQIGALIPVVASNTLETNDSLGNLIAPRDPAWTILACKFLPSASGTSTSDVLVAGSLVTINVPAALAGRKATVSAGSITVVNTTGTLYVNPALYQGATVGGGAIIARTYNIIPNAGGFESTRLEKTITLVAGTMNFFMANAVQGGTGGWNTYGGEQIKVQLT